MGMAELSRELREISRPIWGALGDFLYPPRCAACGNATAGPPWCEACGAKFRRFNEPLCSECFLPLATEKCPQCDRRTIPLFVGYEYRSPLREVILALKFQSVSSAVSPLVDGFHPALFERIAALGAGAVVAVPLTEAREYDRGYNQAEKIAIALAARLGLPCRFNLVRRSGKRPPQSKVTRDQRQENVIGQFSVGEADAVDNPGPIVIIDDVVTTGATCGELTRTLELAGHSVVAWVALAHG